MDVSLVLTVIGADRPGLVDSISKAVVAHEGNWLESHMSRMAGKFAGILRVSAPEAQAAPLMDALQALEKEGLRISIESGSTEADEQERHRLQLDLVGNDRPGIIREIAQVLAKNGVNVDELVTAQTIAPMTGETLFHAKAELCAPRALALESLREELEAIAQDLMVDIHLDEHAET